MSTSFAEVGMLSLTVCQGLSNVSLKVTYARNSKLGHRHAQRVVSVMSSGNCTKRSWIRSGCALQSTIHLFPNEDECPPSPNQDGPMGLDAAAH